MNSSGTRGERTPLREVSNEEVSEGSLSRDRGSGYERSEHRISRPSNQRGTSRAHDSTVSENHERSDDVASNETAGDRRRSYAGAGYPAVACNLVAFEPGSLGLELEAIAGEDAPAAARGSGSTKKGGAEGGGRLGCRVFRVTPDGQAARHGNIHPGDALVVLDGVEVLSKPFEVITRDLLKRCDQRRLIGFMGATDVAAAPTGILPGTIASRAEDENDNRTRRYRNREEERTIGDGDSINSNSNTSINKSRRKRLGSEGRRSTPAATMVAVESQPPEQGHHNNISSAADAGGARDELSPRRQSRATPTSSTIAPAFLDGRGEGSARQSSRAPRPSGVGGESLPSSRRPHAEERGAGVGVGGYSSTPGEGKSGGFGRGYSSLRSSKVAATSCGGRVFSESLGTGITWGGMAAAGRLSGGSSGSRRRRVVQPLERSRGESLQRSLERVMEEKSAMAAEREWLLEQLQRAREVTLEREGQLAGQEVQTDVLKMEVNALEMELRRARQDLGACEAGRREIRDAAKRDLARRDQDAASLSSLLRRERERAARECDDAKAAAATATRAANEARATATAVERRAVAAEERAAAEGGKREAEAAAALQAAGDAAAALRRERERREIEIRQREEEIAALTLRLEVSEGRARGISEEKDSQIREVKAATMKSLEVAERRRSELEKKASAMAARLTERDSEARRLERCSRELEERLEKMRARDVQLEEEGVSEVRRLRRALEDAEKARAEYQLRARAEADRLSRRLREEEGQRAAVMARLRAAEHRSTVVETRALAAQRKAEAGTRKERKALERLAKVETDRACQDVEVTALKTQLKQQRQSAVAGDAATRDNAKARVVLEELIRKRRVPTGSRGVTDPTAAQEDFECEKRELVDLAEAARRLTNETDEELNGVRKALVATRKEKAALLERERDAAELRSLLEEKRGVSAELAGRAESARARAERVEGEAMALRAEASSLRDAVEEAERRARTVEEGLHRKIAELESSLKAARADGEALTARAVAAEAAVVKARAEVDSATVRLAPLEKALEESEARGVDVVRRLTLKDGDCVALRSRLEGTMAELEAVKIALFQGGRPDEKISSRRKACVSIAVILGRHHAREAARAIALLRWRLATLGSPSPRSPRQGTNAFLAVGGEEEETCGVFSDESRGKSREEELRKDAAAAVVRAADAAQSGAEETLARPHAEVLEKYRVARSELASVHLRTRMCGARVLTGVLAKWAARRSAVAYLRLATTAFASRDNMGSASCDRCDSRDRFITDLTIHAPTARGGGGGGLPSWGSPLNSGSSGGGGVGYVELEVGREAQPSVARNGNSGHPDQIGHENLDWCKSGSSTRRRRQRPSPKRECRDHPAGNVSPQPTVVTTLLTSPESEGTVAANNNEGSGGMSINSSSRSVLRPSNSTDGGRRRRDAAAGRWVQVPTGRNGKSSPPPLPLLLPPPSPGFSRERGGHGVPLADAGASSGGAWSSSGGDPATDNVGAAGSDCGCYNQTGGGGSVEVSFISGASSEPRYQCLRSRSTNSECRANSSSSSSGGDEGEGASDGATSTFDVSEGLKWGPGRKSGSSRRSDCSAGNGGVQQQQKQGGSGGVAKAVDVSEGGEAGGGMYGLELQVAVGGDESAWWALSDDSIV